MRLRHHQPAVLSKLREAVPAQKSVGALLQSQLGMEKMTCARLWAIPRRPACNGAATERLDATGRPRWACVHGAHAPVSLGLAGAGGRRRTIFALHTSVQERELPLAMAPDARALFRLQSGQHAGIWFAAILRLMQQLPLPGCDAHRSQATRLPLLLTTLRSLFRFRFRPFGST